MNIRTLTVALVLASPLLWTPALAQAEVERDCVLEGTVKKQSADDERVYVAFHSYRPAEEGANCKIRKKEKLQFKQPAGSKIDSASPGSKVEYRYTEDSEKGATWKLREVKHQGT